MSCTCTSPKLRTRQGLVIRIRQYPPGIVMGSLNYLIRSAVFELVQRSHQNPWYPPCLVLSTPGLVTAPCALGWTDTSPRQIYWLIFRYWTLDIQTGGSRVSSPTVTSADKFGGIFITLFIIFIKQKTNKNVHFPSHRDNICSPLIMKRLLHTKIRRFYWAAFLRSVFMKNN